MSAIVAATKRPAPPKPSVYTKTYTNSPAKAFLAFCSEQRPQLPKGLSPGERETLLGRMPHQYRSADVDNLNAATHEKQAFGSAARLEDELD